MVELFKFEAVYARAIGESRAEGLLTIGEVRTAVRALYMRPRLVNGKIIDPLRAIQRRVYKGLREDGLAITPSTIIQWLKDHWKDILSIILTLLALI
jgi:hypothetical protein